MTTKNRNRVQLDFPVDDPRARSRTKQSFAEQVNINTILKKVAKTGLMPQRSGAFYGDFSDGLSYQESLAKINEANERFLELPVDIRTKFHNEPSELIDFLADPKNKQEAITLGLLEKPKAVNPPPGTPAANPAPQVPPTPPAATG